MNATLAQFTHFLDETDSLVAMIKIAINIGEIDLAVADFIRLTQDVSLDDNEFYQQEKVTQVMRFIETINHNQRTI